MTALEKSQQQAGNRGSDSYFRYSPQSQLLINLLLAFITLALPFTVEAARPKVRIDKIAPVDEGTVVTLNGSNTFDVDGKELTYMWRQVQGPDVVINNPNAPIATFTAPTIEKTNSRTKPVSLRFELEADNGNDKQATASRRVPVRVLPVNNPPIANAGPNRSVTWEAASSGIDLDASASTDDGQIIQYRWKLLTRNNQLPRGAKVSLSNPRAERAAFIFTSPEQNTPVTLDFELFVRDNDRSVDSATVSITVTENITPPIANAGSDKIVIAGSPVTLSGEASTGNRNSYTWEQISGPPVTISSPNSATTGFTTPTVTETTVLVFKLITANSGGSSEDTVSVTVNPVPIITEITPISGTFGETVEISVTGVHLPLTMVLGIDGQNQPCSIVQRSSTQAEFDCWLDTVGIWDLLIQSNSTINGGVPIITGVTHFTVNNIKQLNDTGITRCSNANSPTNLICPVTGFPGQDAEFGRDAQAMAGTLQKIGGGDAGFDFTKLDNDGRPLPASATEWDCVKDNVTGLIWEVKTKSGLRSMYNTYTWYDGFFGYQGSNNSCIGSSCNTYSYVQVVNEQGLCGANDWRMPDVNELLWFANNGRGFPSVDTSYFPNTPSNAYFWSSSQHPYPPNVIDWAMYVHFVYGGLDGATTKNNTMHVRLVRGVK
ncbi:DUF1566 domain-containing protein [Methylotuvimicrobium sp. KM2]|uniref:Lcl C-terminal domain-containing protein n=1 Tax=Methylotuvimicrobium sp. KM2 TaxID=3133976 RepID=UPI003100EE24